MSFILSKKNIGSNPLHGKFKYKIFDKKNNFKDGWYEDLLTNLTCMHCGCSNNIKINIFNALRTNGFIKIAVCDNRECINQQFHYLMMILNLFPQCLKPYQPIFWFMPSLSKIYCEHLFCIVEQNILYKDVAIDWSYKPVIIDGELCIRISYDNYKKEKIITITKFIECNK